MVSVVTNFGRTAFMSGALMNTLPTGSPPDPWPASFFWLLVTNGYDWANANPDHDDITEVGVANVIDPTLYTGNSIDRDAAAWTPTIDDENDFGLIVPATPPVITAGAQPISNIEGIALALQNNRASGNRVLMLLQLQAIANLGANQPFTLNGIRGIGQAA